MGTLKSIGSTQTEDEPRKPVHEEDNESGPLPSSCQYTKVRIDRLIDSNAAITFMSLVTVYALYGDDVRILAFEPSSDGAFLAMSTIAFMSFLLEISLLCWCRDNYLQKPDLEALKEICTVRHWNRRESAAAYMKELGKALHMGSFYFWLDLISTFSMVIEVRPVEVSCLMFALILLTVFLTAQHNTPAPITRQMPWILQGGMESAVDSIDSTMTGKASMAGARAANKLKILRMVRLVRLAKLYKYFSTKQGAKSAGVAPAVGAIPAESHVGAEMSDRTTKKVIVGILIMLMGIPLLQVDEVDYRNEFSMNMVLENRIQLSDGISAGELERWQFSESLLLESTDCIGITYRGFDDGLRTNATIPEGRQSVGSLRRQAIDVITISDVDYVRLMTSVFDASERVREEAFLGMLLTSFVIVLLGLGMISFTKDVRNLVIVPIEKMVQLVKEISENPLGNDFSLKIDDKNKDDGMETTLLIRTISKIAGLMRVGFGEAGADIIGKNLNITEGPDAMNFLGNGRKIHSIFGFCDVRQFTDTTECLQEEVMLFVNRIAHILHSIVVQCDGAANKNIGDAFLLTWKVNKRQLTGCEEHNYSGDKALYSFVKTMIEMSRHEDFLCNFSPRALSELYERMPGYKCRIGCGLHFGWAIEGAIGSSMKIDASYISPHVNMSETLEGASKQYGVPILMSEPFYNLLSEEATAGCRKLDVVKKSMSGKAVGLYTYDVDLSVGFADTITEKNTTKEKTRNNIRKSTFSLVAAATATATVVNKESGDSSEVSQLTLT
jgi:class 3 adenylate cyclase